MWSFLHTTIEVELIDLIGVSIMLSVGALSSLTMAALGPLYVLGGVV